MDPRIFLILPEHISNAYHLWNCALFITQMSNLESTVTNTLTNGNNNTTPVNTTNNVTNNTKQQHIINNKSNNSSDGSESANSVCMDILMNDLNKSQYQYLLLNDFKCDYTKFFESIMTILKIKKRNKASLFNLILPSACLSDSSSSSSSSSLSSTYQSSSSSSSIPLNTNIIKNIKIDLDKNTTPWLTLDIINKDKETNKQDIENKDGQSIKNQSLSSSTTSTNSSNQSIYQKLDGEFNSNSSTYQLNEGCRR